MAWSAIKAAIPPALIQLVIEKLVSMIIPAAGAVMAIIEGLQAAWGSVSAILGAVGKAIAFLKAVKGGGAGPQFASLVAAAAIVVIDFVSNWLLARLGRAILKIAGKIKGIAQKLMKKISGAVKKALGRKKGKGAGKGRAGKQRDKAARDRRAKQLREERKARGKGRHRDGAADRGTRDKQRDDERRRRWDRAAQATRTAVQGLLAKGTPGLLFKARVLALRTRWRWAALSIQSRGPGDFSVKGRMNPDYDIAEGAVTAQASAGPTVLKSEAPAKDASMPEWRDDPLAGHAFPISRERHAAALQPAPTHRHDGGRVQGANPWELATNRFVVGPLARQVAAQHGKSVGTALKPVADPNSPDEAQAAAGRRQQNERRRGSTEDRIDVKPQRMYREQVGGGFFQRTPDHEMLVKERRGRKVEVAEVNLVEQTVDIRLQRVSGSGGRKAVQIPATIQMAARRYPGARIVYHIVAPANAPPETKRIILEDLAATGLGDRVRVVWHAVKPPE